MFRREGGRPSGLAGLHQTLAQSIDELSIGLRKIRKEAVDGLDDHTPLGETGNRAERIQSCLELERHANAQLRVVFDLLSFSGTSRWATGAAAGALFGHDLERWRLHG